MEEIFIRGLRLGDVEDVCHLLDTCFHEEYKKQGFDINKYRLPFGAISILNPFLRLIKLQFFEVFVAECDRKIVGVAIGYKYDRGVWYYGFFATHPDYRGLGIYNKLMEAHLKEAKKRKDRKMVCEILDGNPGPLHVWVDKLKARKTAHSSVYIVDPISWLDTKDYKCMVIRDIDGEQIREYAPFFYSTLSVNRSFIDCIFNWLIPPITIKTLQLKIGDTVTVSRMLTYYPAGMIKIDFFQSPNPHETLKCLISEFVGRQNNKILLYVDSSDAKTREVCLNPGFEYFYDANSLELDIS